MREWLKSLERWRRQLSTALLVAYYREIVLYFAAQAHNFQP